MLNGSSQSSEVKSDKALQVAWSNTNGSLESISIKILVKNGGTMTLHFPLNVNNLFPSFCKAICDGTVRVFNASSEVAFWILANDGDVPMQ